MLSALRFSQSPSSDGSETSKRAGKWQELQFVCDNDGHQVQLVTDETFPLRVQEGSGQAWKVLADKVAWPPKILQTQLWAKQGKQPCQLLPQGRGQQEPLLEGSLDY